MSEAPTIVLVGHCGPDMYMLKNAVQRAVPAAGVESVDDEGSLEAHLSSGTVLLVNRVLDGRFSGASGIELIRRVAAQADPPVCILISNYADAQAEARASGARPGFGKSDLYDEETAQILADAVSA